MRAPVNRLSASDFDETYLGAPGIGGLDAFLDRRSRRARLSQAQQERLRQAGAPAAAIENGIETSDPWGTKLRLIKV